MEIRMVLGPLLAAALGGLSVAAFAYGRQVLRSAPGRWLAWALLGVLGLSFLAAALDLGPAEWISRTSLSRALGTALLVGAALLAARASRLRSRAELMLASAPVSVDDALAALRAGQAPGPGLYRGRLTAEAPVTSPGGIVCAFYEAEVREVAADGGRGRLRSLERAAPRLLYLQGERGSAALAFDGGGVIAPVQIHRCRLLDAVDWAGEGAAAQGVPPVEALSYERVGRLGEPCLVVGRLAPGPAAGSYVLSGALGGPALLVMGQSALAPGRALARRAWVRLSLSAALCAGAAMLLARA